MQRLPNVPFYMRPSNQASGKSSFDQHFRQIPKNLLPNPLPNLKKIKAFRRPRQDPRWRPLLIPPPHLFRSPSKVNSCYFLRFLLDRKKFFYQDSFAPATKNDFSMGNDKPAQQASEPAVSRHAPTRKTALDLIVGTDSGSRQAQSLCERIESLFEICGGKWINLGDSSKDSAPSQMLSDYARFKQRHRRVFADLETRFARGSSNKPVAVLVCKFLFNEVKEEDFARLDSRQNFIWLGFFVNRYFRSLKKRLFAVVEQLASFRELFTLNNKFYFDSASRSKNPQMSCLENEGYVFGFNLWFAEKCEFEKGPFFGGAFERRLAGGQPPNLLDFFAGCAIYFYRLVCRLVLTFVSRRFGKAGVVFDEVEYFEKPFTQLLECVFGLFGLIKQSLLTGAPRTRSTAILNFLNRLLDEPMQKVFSRINEYLKLRELREYLRRKKKSKFVRPRRNDEKLKKIYKNLMKKMLQDFKGQIDTSSLLQFAKTQPASLWLAAKRGPSRHNSSFRDSSNKFQTIASVESRTQDSLFLDGDALRTDAAPKPHAEDLRMLKKSLTSNDIKKLFYEFYFARTASELQVPISHFYDPLKTNMKNPSYKSFTIKYFKLLMKSGLFRNELEEQFREERLLVDILGEYPDSLSKLFGSIPTILIEQQKRKSKFMWTIYEYYFAMYFFKSKLELDIQ